MKKTYEDYIQEIDKKVDSIIINVQKYMPQNMGKDFVEQSIRKAYEYAKQAHKTQSRLSWEPYINHPVEATEILLSLTPDIETIQACLLHDVIEDTEKTSEDITQDFWKEVAFLCEWMEKLSKVKYRGEERAIGSLRKMFVAMAEDLRVIFIKLSDRLHNMQTLNHHPKQEKRLRIAEETLQIYAPIAGRLGLYNFKNDLEEECFKIIHPEKHKQIRQELLELKDAKNEFKKTAVEEMQRIFEKTDVDIEIGFRVKSVYSIYKKLEKKWFTSVKELYDIYGIRIIVNTVSDCYRVLWEIHSHWNTLPYRFKDYVALPKPNGYSSLHTTIIGFLKKYRKQPTEIQIRTHDMHKKAEIWIAAHFEYKEKWSKIATEVNWVSELKELTESIGNSDFMPSLSIDVFKDRIYIFTPKWDAINLPAGSCPIDFAYSVHTDLWDHITIAKVNGTIVPLDRELKNGDVVEIIIDKNKTPTPYSISFVKTVKAKNSIRSFLRKWDKDVHRDRGRDILNNYLERSDLDILDKDMTILKNLDGRTYNTEERWQLLEQVWNFSITPAALLRRIFRSMNKKYEWIKNETKKKQKKKWEVEISEDNRNKNIVIWWESDLDYRICKDCCNKCNTTKIVAHINSKWIFTIHQRNCKILGWVNPERLIPAFIEGKENDTNSFKLDFYLKNKIGALKIISEVLFAMDINIDEIRSKKISKKETLISLSLELLDYDYLIIDRFIDRLKIDLWDLLFEYKIDKINYH